MIRASSPEKKRGGGVTTNSKQSIPRTSHKVLKQRCIYQRETYEPRRIKLNFATAKTFSIKVR